MFRPCIDLHEGRVKQIVGGSIDDARPDALRTNFVSDKPPAWYAELYRRDNLRGGHVIKLGQGNDDAAREALAAWPGGLQIGGGITADNAAGWIDAGASHVIVTSWLFRDGKLDEARLEQLGQAIGQARLVLDLSCRRRGDEYFVVTDRWQTFTELRVNADTLGGLAKRCDEFLIHGVDVEGLGQGIDEALVELTCRALADPGDVRRRRAFDGRLAASDRAWPRAGAPHHRLGARHLRRRRSALRGGRRFQPGTG